MLYGEEVLPAKYQAPCFVVVVVHVDDDLVLVLGKVPSNTFFLWQEDSTLSFNTLLQLSPWNH